MSGEGAPAATERPEIIVFSSFRLDLRGGQLTRAGRLIPLRPKTWAVLVYLAERPAVLVSRDELLDAVWPDVAVTPDTLTKSIGELRVALGDSSTMPRFLETVHRRGFRFIAGTELREIEAAAVWRDADASTSFVGRAAELEQLDHRFARACAGERQIVFLSGPAGVGKTALTEAFLDSLVVRGATLPAWIGRGTCVEQHGPREPYMPVLEALGRLARRTDADRLAGLLRRAAPTWLAQMPWLIDEDAEALRPSPLTVRPERMLREFAALTEALTTDVPLVLVLEDLHWSDPCTVDLLAFLGQRREPARLLIIGTYRPAEAAVHEHALSLAVRTLELRRQCLVLPVHELTATEVGSYLQARFSGAQLPPTLARMLHARTDGNPLFVAAIVEHMLSRGWILDTAPGWSFAAMPDEIDAVVPDDARRMIESQLEDLSPADRSLLGAASVAGNEFVAQALAGPLGCPRDDVETRLETLAQPQRFLRFAGGSEWPDASVALRYTFMHELYRQAVYEGIAAGTRQRLHQRIGEAIENAYGERATEIAGELAVHFEQGGDYPRALRYLAAAASRARQRLAGREAVDYLERALALAARLPDETERRRQELALRLALAPLLNDLCGFPSEELRENCERADELCVEVGTSAQRFQILYAMGHLHMARADPTRLPAVLQELEDLARRLGTGDYRLLADSGLARCAAWQGRFTDCRRLAEGPLATYLQDMGSQRPPDYGGDPVIATSCHYALALWFLGDVERAGATMRGSLAAAERPGVSVFTQAVVLGHMTILEMLRRDAAAVRRLADRLCALADEYGFRYWAAIALALRGWARVQDGELPEAIQELENARAALSETGGRLFSTYILAFLVEAHLRSGEVAAGFTTVDEALRMAETTLDRTYWPELWRLKGELFLAKRATQPDHSRRAGRAGTTPADSSWQKAEDCLQRALVLARDAESKSLELRAATSLARVWDTCGRSTEARTLLDGICRWFGPNSAGTDLTEARALLARLSPARAHRRRPPHHPSA